MRNWSPPSSPTPPSRGTGSTLCDVVVTVASMFVHGIELCKQSSKRHFNAQSMCVVAMHTKMHAPTHKHKHRPYIELDVGSAHRRQAVLMSIALSRFHAAPGQSLHPCRPAC